MARGKYITAKDVEMVKAMDKRLSNSKISKLQCIGMSVESVRRIRTGEYDHLLDGGEGEQIFADLDNIEQQPGPEQVVFPALEDEQAKKVEKLEKEVERLRSTVSELERSVAQFSELEERVRLLEKERKATAEFTAANKAHDSVLLMLKAALAAATKVSAEELKRACDDMERNERDRQRINQANAMKEGAAI